MRAVIQRCTKASVIVDGKTSGSIRHGFLVLLGVEDTDTEDDIHWLANKICKLRIFADADGMMNHSISDVNGDVLVVSQFTLHAKYKKGTRPSFIRAANPVKAEADYEHFCTHIEQLLNKPCQKGVFGAHMNVHLTNDGPVTILIDTKNKE